MSHLLLPILVMAVVTLFTRLLPFLIFGRGATPSPLVYYLGRVLPPAVIAMLVVYCLRSAVTWPLGPNVAQLIAAGVVLLLHLWKKNTLISIFGGTVIYMILVQAVLI